MAAAKTTAPTKSFMATAGLYETSGDWLFDIGLPGKSGIGGGIVTVSPGKGAIGTFAPPLDAAGNSVRGQLVSKFLSQNLGMQPVNLVDATGILVLRDLRDALAARGVVVGLAGRYEEWTARLRTGDAADALGGIALFPDAAGAADAFRAGAAPA